jgi:tRNA(Ile)-lysidine synthase
MSLVERFRESLSALSLEPAPTLVAVSGGPDSLALLDLLVFTRDQHRLSLLVAHVDHGVAPESVEVVDRVRSAANGYGLPFDVTTLALGAGASETECREHRHRALEDSRLAHGAAYVMLGHSLDDQVETVLMRVLHGSGPAGLAGMAPVAGSLIRPLLSFRREELAQYLLERGIEWWDDPANRESRHVRSWLRHELMPQIEGRFPDMVRDMVGLADQAAENRAAWDALLDVLPELNWRDDPDGGSVAAAVLAGYDSGLAAALVQAAARRFGFPLGLTRAARVVEFAGRGRSGATLELPGGWRVEMAFDRLRFLPPANGGCPEPVAVGVEASGTRRWGSWTVTWTPEEAPERQEREGTRAWFVPGTLTVRSGHAGDQILPLGGTGHRSVVRCMQEAKVPRSRRGLWPVVEVDGRVVWVPGVCRSNDLLPAQGTEAVRVDVGHS